MVGAELQIGPYFTGRPKGFGTIKIKTEKLLFFIVTFAAKENRLLLDDSMLDCIADQLCRGL